MLTLMPASTAFNELTVSFCLNMLVRVQFFATFLIATKCPAPFLVFEVSEMEYDDIGLRNLINCRSELKCSHVRNNSRLHVDLCRAMPTTSILRGLPHGFTTLKDTSVHLGVGFGLELGRVTAAISIPKAGSYYCIQSFTRLEGILFVQCAYKNTTTIHMSSSPPVTSMYTCLSKDIMRRQRCEPTTLAKRSALDFVYKTVQVTGLVCESE